MALPKMKAAAWLRDAAVAARVSKPECGRYRDEALAEVFDALATECEQGTAAPPSGQAETKALMQAIVAHLNGTTPLMNAITESTKHHANYTTRLAETLRVARAHLMRADGPCPPGLIERIDALLNITMKEAA